MPFFPRSRREPRRREDEGAGSATLELDLLEFVHASDELGLLRVVGRWIAPVSQVLDEIVLVAARGTETVQLAPLPDLNGVAPVASPEGEPWRAAFTMAVDLAEDPRTELVLLAGDYVRVDLPRPAEWAEAQRALAEAAAAEPSPIVADLVGRLDDVAMMENEPPEPELPEPPADDTEPFADHLEPLADHLEPLADFAEHAAPIADHAEPPVEHPPLGDVDPLSAHELDGLRAELELLRVQLQEARTEVELERRRRRALDDELNARRSVEDDLRNAIATQEAELASAAEQASLSARRAERRRDLPQGEPGGERTERSHSVPATDEFLARLERARRAGETAV